MLADPALGWSEAHNWPKRLDLSFLLESESVVRAFSAGNALFVQTSARLLNLSAGGAEIEVPGGAAAIRALSVGNSHFALAAADGRVLLAGSNEFGQLCQQRSKMLDSGSGGLVQPEIGKVTQVVLGAR